jgi:hypothetical protein
MVEALPQLMAAPDSNNLHGRLVTLGTPFIDTMSPILRRSERGAKVLRVVSWIIFAILILMLLSLLSYFGLANVGVYFFGILIFLFLIGIFFRIKRRTDHRDYWPIIDAPDHTQPQLLAIGSPMDEPWQVLHHMRIADNPLAVRSNFLSYILSSLRSIVIQRGTVARIHGARSYRDLGWLAKLIMAFLYLSLGFLLFGLLILPDQESASRAGRTAARADEAWLGIVATTTFLFCVLVVFTQLFGREFFSAFFAPFRWCVRLVGSVVNVFPAVMTYGVRYLGWSVLLKIAMGLEGYRFTLPLVEQFPHNVPENFGKYEDMPKQAQQCAMDKRSAWIARHLGDVSQTFGKMAITATDINSLLRAIEEDQSLVHAAYYTDEECIARIADWIAGTG